MTKKENIVAKRIQELDESDNPPKTMAEYKRALITQTLHDEELQEHFIDLFSKDPIFEGDSREVIRLYLGSITRNSLVPCPKCGKDIFMENHCRACGWQDRGFVTKLIWDQWGDFKRTLSEFNKKGE